MRRSRSGALPLTLPLDRRLGFRPCARWSGGSGGSRLRRPRLAAVLALTVAATALAACDASASSSAQPPPSSPPTTSAHFPLSCRPRRSPSASLGDDRRGRGLPADGLPVRPAQPPGDGVGGVLARRQRDDRPAFADGAKVPDVFLATRRYLPWLMEHQTIQPVDQLLDERGVDFGDSYPRSTLTAFAVDNAPDLPALRHRAHRSSTTTPTWSSSVRSPTPRPSPVRAGASTSSRRPRGGPSGTARARPGCTSTRRWPASRPFVYSGGGELFDDAAQPTSHGVRERSPTSRPSAG